MSFDNRADPLRAAAVDACRRAAHADPAFVPTADLALESLGELGRGGMGLVERVRDRRLGRQAALKRLLHPTPDAMLRFDREARVTAGLDHPSIPPVFEAGNDAAGRPFMLMRVVEGESLSKAIGDRHKLKGAAAAVRERELLEALVKVAQAVAYAHSRGVVHRDLKPANVMLGRFGEVIVMDWGVALVAGSAEPTVRGPSVSALQQSAGSTEAGSLLGTLGYMSPEQANGDKVDERADVFSLGAILVEILTGAPPVDGPSTASRLTATVTGKIALPRDRRRDVPADLDGIAARALAVVRDDRTRSADAFVVQLRAWLAGDMVPGHRYGPVTRMGRWVSRHPAVLVTVVIGALLATAVAALGIQRVNERARTAASQFDSQLAEERRRDAERARTEADAARRRAEKIITTIHRARLLSDSGAPAGPIGDALDAIVDLDPHGLGPSLAIFVMSSRRQEERVVDRFVKRLSAADYKGLGGEDLILMSRCERRAPGQPSPALDRLVTGGGDPKSEPHLFARAILANERGDPGEALRVCGEARTLGHESARILLERAHALCLRNELDAALAELARAEVVAPLSVAVHANRGTVHVRKKQFKEAIAALTRAIEIDPGDGNAFFNRGIARVESGDEEGHEDFARAAELKHPNARTIRAQIFSRTGRDKRAVHELDIQLATHGDDDRAWYFRGLARDRLGDKDGAIADLKKCMQIRPGTEWARMAEGALARIGGGR